MTGMEFAETLTAVQESQDRLLDSTRLLSVEAVRGPSLLPEWSVGHVLTHLARSADATHRLVRGISSGITGPMYPGGPEARAAAIEEGADRPVSLLVADLEFAGNRLITELGLLSPSELMATVAWRRPVTADFLPQLRWRELEIHHVDLGCGYTIADWPSEFVRSCLRTELSLVAQRAPGVVLPSIAEAELLAWLIGRSTDPELPELPAWL